MENVITVSIQKDNESTTWIYLLPLCAGQGDCDVKLLNSSLWKNIQINDYLDFFL